MTTYSPCLQLHHHKGGYSIRNMQDGTFFFFPERCTWLKSGMACTVTESLQARTVETLLMFITNGLYKKRIKLPFPHLL